ncbi:MAG: alkyl sulfatase C-terminal domain-containing protein, partial [Hyphomonas sp.]
FMVLGRWAARSPAHDPTLPISAVSIMLSFKTMFDAGRAGKAAMALGFVFDDESFRVTVSEGGLQAQRGEIAGVDVTVTIRPPLLAAAVYGKVPLATLAADMTIDGDQGVFERFAGPAGISFGLVVNLIGMAVLLLWIPLRQRPGIGTVANVLVIGTVANLGLDWIPSDLGLP